MAEINENLDPGAGIPASEAGGDQGGAGGDQWTGPSREEWQTVLETNKRLQSDLEGLTGVFAQAPEPQYDRGGNEFDLSQLDMTDPYQAAWLMDQIAMSRMNTVAPYVKNAAQDQGQRQMQSLLDGHAKELSSEYPAGFDKQLAERAAFAFFDESGDAEGSVAAGARYAAEVRKAERDAAISDYQKKNRRGGAFSDLGAGESGVTAAPKLKTYDEVLSKYASQDEV